MRKDNRRVRAEKLLRNLNQYRTYADYYEALEKNDSLPPRKSQAVKFRAVHYREVVKALDAALGDMSKLERDVVTLLYIMPDNCVDDVCDIVAAERSTVYRYRASALDKIAELML